MTGVTGELLKEFLMSIAPTLISFSFGLILALNGALIPEYASGISNYIFYVGLPTLVFRRLALNDPSSLDFRLLGADALSKFIPLGLLLLWWRCFSTYGKIESLEWVITYFMLCTLPNTVLLGDSILRPMYGESIDIETTTLIFAQTLYWYNLVISLYEIRELMLEDERKKASILPMELMLQVQLQEPENSSSTITAETVRQVENTREENTWESAVVSGGGGGAGTLGTQVTKAYSELELAFQRNYIRNHHTEELAGRNESGVESHQSPTKSRNQNCYEKTTATDENLKVEDLVQSLKAPSMKEYGPEHKPVEVKDCQKSDSVTSSARIKLAAVTTLRVVRRILKTPLLYGSSGGFIYSLFAFRYHWKMPPYIQNTLSLLGDGTIGMAMVVLGMVMAFSIKSSKGFIACGVKLLLVGFAARFLFEPIIMYISSLVFVIKGTILRYSVVQIIVPQGTMTFALARVYNCKLSTLSTAVSVQLIIFVPVILAYYAALEAI